MLTHTRLALSLWIVISLLLSTALAQEQKKVNSPAPLLTATTSGVSVRLVGLGEVREMRLELFSQTGQLVYDSSFHSGNLLDYHLADQGARTSSIALICLRS